jgi:hypothetical protein
MTFRKNASLLQKSNELNKLCGRNVAFLNVKGRTTRGYCCPTKDQNGVFVKNTARDTEGLNNIVAES